MLKVVFSILFIISLCAADQFLCRVFNETTRALELYCGNVENLTLKQCSSPRYVDSFKVDELKIFKCDNKTTAEAVNLYNKVRVLDITYSEYKLLEWFDVRFEQLQQFNASHNKLYNFVWILLWNMPEITEIDLSFNSLRNIYNDNSSTLNNLVMINLSHNYLRYIEYGTFENCINLTFIDLTGNFLRTVPSFGRNINLRTISLMNNNIQLFDFCSYAKMNTVTIHFTWMTVTNFVKSDNCDETQLKPFHVVEDSKNEGIFATANGTHEIHCNDLSFHSLINFTAGPNALENVYDLLPYFGPSLRILDLSGNRVHALNATIFDRFDHLQELMLSNTKLIEFDYNLLKSRRLTSLDISSNGLKSMANIPSLTKLPLTRFSTKDNHFDRAPDFIQHLRASIYELNLSGNFLGRLNVTTFQRFTKLKTLQLSATSLFIPAFNPFESLKGLRILDISHNNLANVNFSILSTTLIRLNDFNAAYCHIENASELIQYFGPTLEKLDLSGNSLGIVNIRTFETMKSLEYLYLSNVKMVNFDIAALQYQSCLQILDISDNELQYLDLRLMPNNLRVLHLQGNALNRIDNLRPSSISMTISMNQFSCIFLRQFISYYKFIKFIDDPLDQKHGKDCRSSTQGISDFLDSVFERIKFW